jgi:hypothetical protein
LGTLAAMTRRRTVLSALVPSLVVAAIATVTAVAVAQDAQPVQGDGFATTLPAGWTAHDYASVGGHAWGFASPGATTNKLATPTPGGIGVTAWVAKVPTIEHRLGRLPTDPVKLVKALTGLPKAAKGARVAVAAHTTTLAGAKAGTMTFSYRLGKRAIVQRDVAVRRGGKLYEVELDVDHANAAKGQDALRAILAAWSWSA